MVLNFLTGTSTSLSFFQPHFPQVLISPWLFFLQPQAVVKALEGWCPGKGGGRLKCSYLWAFSKTNIPQEKNYTHETFDGFFFPSKRKRSIFSSYCQPFKISQWLSTCSHSNLCLYLTHHTLLMWRDYLSFSQIMRF